MQEEETSTSMPPHSTTMNHYIFYFRFWISSFNISFIEFNRLIYILDKTERGALDLNLDKI